MDKLYTDMARVYEIMYRQFMDYDSEFSYYHALLQQNNVKSVLELGCGAGNNAERMLQNGYDYIGLDLSADMLALARKRLPLGVFVQADMSDFYLNRSFSAVLLVGRTTAYLLTNSAILNMLRCARQHLVSNGILVFDVIDAFQFLPTIQPALSLRHTVEDNGTTYWRDSVFSCHLETAWTWHWAAQYFQQNATDAPAQLLGKDDNILRSFTADEIRLFLQLSGFEVIAQYPKDSYAFPTWVFVARKIG
jgi:SAM-dependent methyltransferase